MARSLREEFFCGFPKAFINTNSFTFFLSEFLGCLLNSVFVFFLSSTTFSSANGDFGLVGLGLVGGPSFLEKIVTKEYLYSMKNIYIYGLPNKK